MKRRNFIKNMSLASVAAPIVVNNIQFKGIAKKLFTYSKMAENRVLVIIRLNGGNDGLNSVIPIDQYDNLMIQRPNIIIPEPQILPITDNIGFHPVMTGMKNMFDSGKLAIIQDVGYPEQNRSHFRSMDIWSTGSIDIEQTRGWLGRNFDMHYEDFPAAYPNTDYPHPFAISMGYETSTTCQGLMGNFSHAVANPTQAMNVNGGTAVNDGTYFGDHMEYITTIINQTNAYGAAINSAANGGSSLSSLYDANNPIAVQLRDVAKMISGGLQSKVYILNINGFDTHDNQVTSDSSTTTGMHADLMKTLSDAIYAFQDDLQLLGLENRVAGMTFSEFGRQVASNYSLGTDHGDAAPMFLFGTCVSGSVIGNNPTIGDQIVNQAGIPIQYDFRDIYASILKDWFLVDPLEIQTLFEHDVNFVEVLAGCGLSVEEKEFEKDGILIYPNPCVSSATLRFVAQNERVHIELFDLNGRSMQVVTDQFFDQGTHNVFCDLHDMKAGRYQVRITKPSGILTKALVKI
jgi:uncharacterized protein (DUF1501 family)